MGKQINQYTKTRTAATIQGDDLLGPDSTEDTGTTFESAKMKVSELLAYINANVDNLYRIDGSLTGSRNVTLDSHTLSFVQGKICKPDVFSPETFDGASQGFPNGPIQEHLPESRSLGA